MLPFSGGEACEWKGVEKSCPVRAIVVEKVFYCLSGMLLVFCAVLGSTLCTIDVLRKVFDV